MGAMRSLLLRLLPLSLVVCASCGINNGIYSCIVAASNYCVDYGTVDQFTATTSCGVIAGGSTQSTACPATNRVGSCARNGETVRYYSPGFDDMLAQSACTADSGTYTTGR